MTSPTIDLSPSLHPVSPADMALAGAIANKLCADYPGHPWAASASHHDGVVIVRNLGLSDKWGFVLKIEDLKSDPALRLATKAGGELLERYRIHRGKAIAEDYAGRKHYLKPTPGNGL